MYKPEYFRPYEFVPKSVHDYFGVRSINFMDERILMVADQIRDYFARPVYINIYESGLENRGWRFPFSSTGSKLSTHKYGWAIDFNVEDTSAQDVYMEIITHEEDFFQMGVKRVEKVQFTPTWTHIDVMETNLPVIKFFNV